MISKALYFDHILNGGISIDVASPSYQNIARDLKAISVSFFFSKAQNLIPFS